MAFGDKQRGGKPKKKSITMVVGPFRMAFPALLEAEETDSGDRFKVTALFPPDYNLNPIWDAMEEVMTDAFGPEADWPSGRNDVQPEDKLYKAEKNEKWNGFKKGWWAMSMSSTEAPGLVDADKNEVMSKREVYGGRWARAQVNITTYDNKSKGVGVYLNHVQLLDHDEAFSGRGNAADAFDKYELKDRRSGDEREERGSRDRGDRSERGSRDRETERGTERRGDRSDDRQRERGGRAPEETNRGGSSRERGDRDRSADRGERGGRSERRREPEADDDVWN
jgi:hypothetical protein